MATGRLGFLATLFSRPVIIGFISAAATLIGCGQLGNLLGLDVQESDRFHTIVIEVTAALGGTHLPTLLVGLMGILSC